MRIDQQGQATKLLGAQRVIVLLVGFVCVPTVAKESAPFSPSIYPAHFEKRYLGSTQQKIISFVDQRSGLDNLWLNDSDPDVLLGLGWAGEANVSHHSYLVNIANLRNANLVSAPSKGNQSDSVFFGLGSAWRMGKQQQYVLGLAFETALPGRVRYSNTPREKGVIRLTGTMLIGAKVQADIAATISATNLRSAALNRTDLRNEVNARIVGRFTEQIDAGVSYHYQSKDTFEWNPKRESHSLGVQLRYRY